MIFPFCRILLLCCALLIACDRPAPVSPSSAVNVVFKHSKLFGDSSAFDRLISEFELGNPGIRVERQTLPSSSDAQHQFYAINFQARSSAFDVLAVDVIWVAEFARSKWLRDLSHLLPSGEFTAFFSGPTRAVTYEGKIFAIPWFIDAGLLYYRKDLLQQYGFSPPETWDQLVHIARTIVGKETKLYGFVWQGKQYEGLICNALEYIWSNGGDVLHERRVVLDSASNRKALEFMRDLVVSHRVTPDFVTTDTEETSRRVFGSGRAVFLRNWPYAWNLFQQEGSMVKNKVGVALLPHFPGHRSVSTLGGWQLGINRNSLHPEAAEKLVKFLTSPRAQRALSLAYGFHPTRKSLYRETELLQAQPLLGQLHDIFEQARPRPVTPFYIMISQVLQSEFSAVIAGVKPADMALQSAQTRVEKILAHGD